jgi:hypothetical protein
VAEDLLASQERLCSMELVYIFLVAPIIPTKNESEDSQSVGRDLDLELP